MSAVGACRYCRHSEHDACKQIGWTDSVCCDCTCETATVARMAMRTSRYNLGGAATTPTIPRVTEGQVVAVITTCRDLNHAAESVVAFLRSRGLL